MNEKELREFRERFDIPISDDDIAETPFYRPPANSPETKYLLERREKLGGFLPERKVTAKPLDIPKLESFAEFFKGSGLMEVSTTMAFVRLLSTLLRNKAIGKQIVSDHSRRSAHVRSRRALPRDRHLLLQRPALRAGRYQVAALLSRSQGRPDSRRRHHRSRFHVLVHRRGHQLRLARETHDPVLHLLFDVRLPAHRRFDLARRRHQGERFSARRNRRPHHAERRRPATRGRPQPAAREHHPHAAHLRSRVRLRSRGHHRGRHAAHVRRTTRTSSITSRSTTKTTPCRRCPRAWKKAF